MKKKPVRPVTFCEYVRRRLQLTQVEFAELVAVSPATISHIETGRRCYEGTERLIRERANITSTVPLNQQI